jgi:hypothetical protein
MLVHFKAPPWWQQAKMAYTFNFGHVKVGAMVV